MGGSGRGSDTNGGSGRAVAGHALKLTLPIVGVRFCTLAASCQCAYVYVCACVCAFLWHTVAVEPHTQPGLATACEPRNASLYCHPFAVSFFVFSFSALCFAHFVSLSVCVCSIRQQAAAAASLSLSLSVCDEALFLLLLLSHLQVYPMYYAYPVTLHFCCALVKCATVGKAHRERDTNRETQREREWRGERGRKGGSYCKGDSANGPGNGAHLVTQLALHGQCGRH